MVKGELGCTRSSSTPGIALAEGGIALVNVGVCYMELLLFEINSLKDKRRIIKSILERVRSRFNVSISEVGRQDSKKYADIGIAAVSGDHAGTDRLLQGVFNFIDHDGRVEVTDYTFRSSV